MSANCCDSKSSELMKLREKQSRVLKIVLAINLTMFVLEFSMGLWAKSTALMGDSLDMFGDAVVYGFSLYVLHKSERTRATAAFLKGLIIVAFGLWVLYESLNKIITDVVPVAEAMGVVGVVAMVANVSFLYLLMKHKDDDINMKSTYVCSRNDIISNTGVIFAAGLVAFTNSKWPDLIVGLVIAALFLRSAFPILVESTEVIRRTNEGARQL